MATKSEGFIMKLTKADISFIIQALNGFIKRCMENDDIEKYSDAITLLRKLSKELHGKTIPAKELGVSLTISDDAIEKIEKDKNSRVVISVEVKDFIFD